MLCCMRSRLTPRTRLGSADLRCLRKVKGRLDLHFLGIFQDGGRRIDGPHRLDTPIPCGDPASPRSSGRQQPEANRPGAIEYMAAAHQAPAMFGRRLGVRRLAKNCPERQSGATTGLSTMVDFQADHPLVSLMLVNTSAPCSWPPLRGKGKLL